MARTEGYDRVGQGDALTRLRMRARKSRTQIAVELGMEADTYRRYETGQTELRVAQIPAFARSYGISPADLLAALGVIDHDAEADPAWSFRAALAGRVPDDLIDDLAAEWEGRGILDQKAAAGSILRMASRDRNVTKTQRHSETA